MDRLLLSLVFVCTLVGHVEAGIFSRFLGHQRLGQREESRSDHCMQLRGGSSDGKGSEEKIKGTCIGIDLGTTYR